MACAGVDIDIKLLGGLTAKEAAKCKKHTSIATLITDAEADIRWKNSDEYKEQQRKIAEEMERERKAQEEKQRVEAVNRLKMSKRDQVLNDPL